jgi:hypothetical protein
MRTLIIGTIFIFIMSCQQRSKINYENKIDTIAVEEIQKDTTKILVAQLPVKFDSTESLIFAVSAISISGRNGISKSTYDYYGSTDSDASYFRNDHLTGDFVNVIFRDNNGNDRKLTHHKMKISDIVFLRPIFESTRKGFILYIVNDRDTNGDNVYNYQDLEALYISKADGSEFKKLSKELNEFYDYTIIKGEAKLYFRTLEDRNKDGVLNNKDKFHHFQLEFTSDNYTISEYNPIKILE